MINIQFTYTGFYECGTLRHIAAPTDAVQFTTIDCNIVIFTSEG
jgi:hypothetical protein